MSDLYEEIMIIAHLFLMSPGFALWMGVMISVAIFVGYILLDELKDLWKWLVVLALYLLFRELMRISYSSADILIPADPFRPIFVTVLSAILFAGGIALGGWISLRSKQRRALHRARTERIIEEIKTNGGNGKEILCKENIK